MSLFSIFGGGKTTMPEGWQTLTDLNELSQIIEQSKVKPQVLFKHSTRCSISSAAYDRLASGSDRVLGVADIHYLDLIQHRDISNAIAQQLKVTHQSPQIIVLENGKVIHDASHMSVRAEGILEAI